ncbi:MAG: hypothetical protein PVH63_03520 [Balneolaceae bacterium]|jgi:hypothetical protein
MEVNELPRYDTSDNPTGCCPRFKPEGWDGQELHFENKPFVKATTRSLFHVPMNMGSVFSGTFSEIEKAGATDEEQFVVLTNDVSPWKSEHYFSVNKEVPGQEMVYLTGDYATKVFEGPYKEARKWYKEMKEYIKQIGMKPGKIYFFYTTCPNCAKYYGKNYVVGFGEET